MTALASPEPVSLFYSYSHKDEEFREKLEEHLAVLKRQNLIMEWHDRKIAAGTEWKGEIDENLEKAEVILLLVSASFLASDYCYDVEMKRALERHQKDARVIPVILRPCEWRETPLKDLEALPKDARPITKWDDLEDAFLDVTRGIRRVIEELRRPMSRRRPAERDRRLPQDSSLLCNRTDQEEAFYDACDRLMKERRGFPQIYIVPGEVLDRHELLVDRLRLTKIPALAAIRSGSTRHAATWEQVLRTGRLTFKKMDDFKVSLARKLFEQAEAHDLWDREHLFAAPLVTHKQWNLHSFVVIQHDIDAADLHAGLFDFLHWYSHEFWVGSSDGTGPQFLIFVNLHYPEESQAPKWQFWKQPKVPRQEVIGSIRRELAKLDKLNSGCPCICLPELNMIYEKHLEHWFVDQKASKSIEDARGTARKIYALASGKSRGEVRMEHVYPLLDAYVRGELHL